MYSPITILGTGPASLGALFYLLNNGYSMKDLMIIDLWIDPLVKNLQPSPNGFMGVAFNNDMILPAEPGVGGDLLSYATANEAQDILTEVINLLKSFSTTFPNKKNTPFAHYKLTKDSFDTICRAMWQSLYKQQLLPKTSNEIIGLGIGNVQYNTPQGIEVLSTDYIITGLGRNGYNTLYNTLYQSNAHTGGTITVDVQKNAQYIALANNPYTTQQPTTIPKLTNKLQIEGQPNYYIVGDLGTSNSVTVAMAQGMLAAKDILNRI